MNPGYENAPFFGPDLHKQYFNVPLGTFHTAKLQKNH